MSNLEDRLLAKFNKTPTPEKSTENPVDILLKPKLLKTDSKINITGGSQSFEDLCKAMGIPVKKSK